MNAIDVRSLLKVFSGKPVLQDFSMTVRQGEIYGLLGPNGAGKTTVLRILLGLLDPTSGDVRVLGQNPFSSGRGVRSRLGFVPENTRFCDWLDPIENIYFYAQLEGVNTSRNAVRHRLIQGNRSAWHKQWDADFHDAR